MRILIMGAPGAGKGTQAKKLASKLNVAHISSGDIFRRVIRKRTKLGIKAKKYIDKGQLVPCKLAVGIIKERLKEEDCELGYILDGFPRTVVQAESLDEILEEMKESLDFAIDISVAEEDIVMRLEGRRSCSKCGRVYHLVYNPPKKEDYCDVCKISLYQRDDDQREVILNRLKVYREKTQPLIDYYKKRGILKTVNGNQSVKMVLKDILKLLGVVTAS